MTVLDLMRTTIADDPDAPFMIVPRPDGDERITRAEFGTLAASLARQLRDHGVGEGDCIGVWLPNWPIAFAAQFAANALGAHVIGINTRYNVAEVSHVVLLARPKVILLAHEFVGLDLIGRLREARASSLEAGGDWADPQVVPIAGEGQSVTDVSAYDVGGGSWLLDDVAGESLDDFTPAASNPLVIAFTTSGSTGMPKLAAHDDYSVLQHAHASARAMELTAEDVFICALPFSGTFGFTAAMAVIAGGSTLLMHPSFKPGDLARQIPAYGVTSLAFGDDMLGRLKDEWQSQEADFSSLRWVGMADFNGESGPIGEWLESIGVFATGVYGSSEVFALTSMWPTSVPAPDRWKGGGRLVSDEMQIRIADSADVEVPRGDEGELQFRGPNVVTTYLGQPEKMADNFSPDGWFKSGDLARQIDDQSFLYLCRMTDALRLKGFLVEPDEIALHLATHPSVELAKVVGAKTGGETEAVGFVTLRPGKSVEDGELVDYCRNALAKFKVPVAVYVIDEMPTTASANGTKIKGVTLREWAVERRTADQP